jgi:hypothetical protein
MICDQLPAALLLPAALDSRPRMSGRTQSRDTPNAILQPTPPPTSSAEISRDARTRRHDTHDRGEGAATGPDSTVEKPCRLLNPILFATYYRAVKAALSAGLRPGLDRPAHAVDTPGAVPARLDETHPRGETAKVNLDATRPTDKQGNRLVRWAAIEAVARYHGGPTVSPTYQRVARRRGRNIGRVAAARKLLTLVYYGLRDGNIRCLAETT